MHLGVRYLLLLRNMCKNPFPHTPRDLCMFYIHNNVHLLLYTALQWLKPIGNRHSQIQPHPRILILGIPPTRQQMRERRLSIKAE